MRLMTPNWAMIAAASALFLASCNDTHESSFDKNTNWLEACTESAACGAGLQCVCGVCTSVCDRDTQCAVHDPAAICVSSSTMANACGASDPAASLRVCLLASGAAAIDAAATDDAAADDAAIDDGGRPGVALDDMLAPNRALVATANSTCAAGFSCQVAAAAPHAIKSIVAGDDGFVYWLDWGTLDALDNHRHDGAIVRKSQQSGAHVVLSDLDRPWRLWLDGGSFYVLSGEPGSLRVGHGMQTLFAAPIDGSSPPVEVMSDPFANLLVHEGELFWNSPYAYQVAGDSTALSRWNIATRSHVWTENHIGVEYMLDGVDDTKIYMDDRSLNIAVGGLDGAGVAPWIIDTPAFLVTVADDALWLIHVDADDDEWVSSMSKQDGSITHIGNAAGYYDRPQPGASVVWLVTGEPGSSTWQLWSTPKTGGERALAFSWPTEHGTVRADAPDPVWIAAGDEAWVYAHGALVHVR